MRVVVLGAGLAGLAATLDLGHGGADVSLIEASQRPGGRARTVHDAFTGGQYAESGAEWVDTHHHRMLGLLGRYGISLQGRGQEWTTIRRMLFRDGALLGPEQVRALEPGVERDLDRYEAAFEAIAVGIADPSRPQDHPQAATHDARSMADIAAELELGQLAALFARRNSQGEFAAELAEVSSLFVAQQRAQMTAHEVSDVVRAHRVDGGLGRLVAHLVGDVGEALSLGEAVESISWGDAGVEVRTDRRTVVADRLVITCALAALRRVRFEPGLPPGWAEGIAALGYGTVTKTAVQFAERSWPDGYTNTTSAVQRVYEPTVDQPGTTGVLMGYTGGDGGRSLARLDEPERLAVVTADMRAMYGLTGSALGGFSRAWSAEPRFGGSYAAYGPGQVTAHWQALRVPCGPMVLAGEHVATWTGYLEGAVESGQAAAAHVLASA